MPDPLQFKRELVRRKRALSAIKRQKFALGTAVLRMYHDQKLSQSDREIIKRWALNLIDEGMEKVNGT